MAVIYGKANRASYRVSWTANGRRMMKCFRRLTGEDGAIVFAEKQARDLSKGNATPTLTAREANDCLIALRRLDAFFKQSGQQVTLPDAVDRYCTAAARLTLPGVTVPDAIEKYLSTVATVKPITVAEAVDEFNKGRKHLGESKEGERSKRSPVYLDNTARWLREFARTIQNTNVNDLRKEHLDAYIAQFVDLSAKSRNDRRAIVKQFLRWCVRKDYLASNHRLFEATGFAPDDADPGKIDFYRPDELRRMLHNADAQLLPVLALQGLAGLRREEVLRLDWGEVWRVKGKIEISERIAKCRQRRLVSICTALAKFLAPYRNAKGPVWPLSADVLEERMTELRDGLKIPARRNGLRHAFATFHHALHNDENLTAAECGHSPQMLHTHYRGLVTRKEAQAWFAIRLTKAQGNVINADFAANA